jgi:hypothetical protein
MLKCWREDVDVPLAEQVDCTGPRGAAETFVACNWFTWDDRPEVVEVGVRDERNVLTFWTVDVELDPTFSTSESYAPAQSREPNPPPEAPSDG